MVRIAVLGTGAMGSRMATRLIAAGHAVTVWNRTAAMTAPLVAAGGRAATTPHDAAADAAFVISMVRDDAASHAAWLDPDTGALVALAEDAVAIESSTLSGSAVCTLAAAMARRGIDFLDAPVAGSRPQADAGQLIYFVGGDAGALARAEPVLGAMAAVIHHVGGVGAGTAVKLAVNTLFGVQVAALAEILAMLGRAGIDVPGAVDVLTSTPACSPAAKAAAASMVAGQYAPLFPVALVEKDLGYALASADGGEWAAPVTRAARAVFGEAIRQGLGGDHLTVVARLHGSTR